MPVNYQNYHLVVSRKSDPSSIILSLSVKRSEVLNAMDLLSRFVFFNDEDVTICCILGDDDDE